ncbi:transposase [Kitasatospora cinereorecta]|uniref:Transposase n=1 Tax=Kitasatospora cinereorecta TaxID=285560 RepID=A0ABW0VQA7_9ACTN
MDRLGLWQPATGEHRKHARVEPKIRDQKASGMGLLPSREMTVNTAWLTATAIASDLRAWLQLLALDGEEAKATPKTLRHRILHVPALLVRGRRKRRLKVPTSTGRRAPQSPGPWNPGVARHDSRRAPLTGPARGQGSTRHHGHEINRPLR